MKNAVNYSFSFPITFYDYSGLVSALKSYGLVNHTIWIEKQKDSFFQSAWLARKHTKLYIKMKKQEFGEIDREVYERLNCAEMLQQRSSEKLLLNKNKIKSKEIVKTSREDHLFGLRK